MSSAEKQREAYQWYKEHGICVQCHQENARKGRVLCGMCAASQTEAKLIRYHAGTRKEPTEEQRRRKAETAKKLHEKRSAQGLCFKCGKHPAIHPGQPSRCRFCLEKEREKSKKYRSKKGAIPAELRGKGLYCYHCCKPVCHGESTCPACREKKSREMKEWHANGGSKNNGFRETMSIFFKPKTKEETP